jgi:putative phosphoribosyl transferase
MVEEVCAMRFADRGDAGRRLAAQLGYLRGPQLVVLGVPRGGMPVAFEVARALGAPLDIVVVRKLGVPYQPELAMGAVGEGGVTVINPHVVSAARVNDPRFAAAQQAASAEVERRVHRLRGDHPRIPLAGRTALVVDDGIATGASISAACQVVRAHGAARVIVATPVAPATGVAELSRVADEVHCLSTPAWFSAVGEWYDDFTPTTDDQVVALLDRAATAVQPAASAVDPAPSTNPKGAGAAAWVVL